MVTILLKREGAGKRVHQTMSYVLTLNQQLSKRTGLDLLSQKKKKREI